MRFINPQKESYHNTLIREYSENSRFIAAGSTKGFVRNRYAWFADFAGKFSENTSFNTHVAYISFFSDHDIFVSEYSNVDQVTDTYPFLIAVADSKISGHDHELSTKQYFKLSNRYSAFDIIEFVNESYLHVEDVGYDSTITKYHNFYYAPVVYEVGYKIDKGQLGSPETQDDYDMYLWANRYASGTQMKVIDYGFILTLAASGTDYPTSFMGDLVNSALLNAQRLVDYKVLPYEIGWKSLEDDSANIFYPFLFKDEEPWTYRPYIGFMMSYNNQTDSPNLIESQNYGMSLFPQVSFDDVIEKQKALVYGTYYDKSMFHASGLSYETDDQSQLVFNISRYQSYKRREGESTIEGFFGWIGQKMSDGTKIVGIDLEAERNRRYSAVVTTEPYMAVRPIHNGKVIDYKFVKANGDDIDAGAFPGTYQTFCLKIKAPRSFIASLDAELSKQEYNTDIMHTVSVEDPLDGGIVTTSTNDYDFFDGSVSKSKAISRQNFCLDDLVDGIVGNGKGYYFSFPLNQFPLPTISGYDGQAKVVGLGYHVKTYPDGSFKEFANAYCCNYTPAGPNSGNLQTTAMDFAGDLLFSQYELFRPMLKLPGIRGYIKIMSRSEAFKSTVLKDGLIEVVYDIEFPYCPGTYEYRSSMIAEYNKTQIFRKESYINAGDHSVDSNGKINGNNERFVPSGDSAFSRIESYVSADSSSATIDSDPESLGGSVTSNLVSRPRNRIIYPANLVYSYAVANFIGLTKPRSTVANLTQYGQYGTFEIYLTTSSSYHNGDLKIVWCADNRSWRYGKDQYSSYVNHECPSYVLKLDASALSNEVGRDQYKYAGIPDIKRWVYANVIAFCSTNGFSSSGFEDDEANTDGSFEIPTKDSDSDVMIEIWDSAYKIGPTDSDIKAMWRPFSTSVFDNDKAPSKLLVSGLHADSAKTHFYGSNGEYNLFRVTLNKYVYEEGAFSEGLDLDESTIVDGVSNLVLTDSASGESYHVAYITQDMSDSDIPRLMAYITMYVSSTGDSDTLSDGSGFFIDPYSWEGPISISTPYSKLSKSTEFKFTSCKAVKSEITERYADFGDKEENSSDFNRYVDSNGNIYVRIRPLKNRTYPVSYDSVFGQSDILQWLGTRCETASAQSNFPWYNPSAMDYDTIFDWSKIGIIERVNKFGLNYASLQSK